MKTMKNHGIPHDNKNKNENHRISFEHQTIFGDHRTPRENYQKMKILELYTIIEQIIVFHWRIMQIMKLLEFNQRIMRILEIYERIMKSMKIIEFH